MLKLVRNTHQLIITRGDTGPFKAVPLVNHQPYVWQPGDIAYFTVRAKAEKSSPVLIQIYSDDGNFEILPEHTAGLGLGDYRYDIHLKTAAGKEFTYITGLDGRAALFTVREEVTGNG